MQIADEPLDALCGRRMHARLMLDKARGEQRIHDGNATLTEANRDEATEQVRVLGLLGVLRYAGVQRSHVAPPYLIQYNCIRYSESTLN